LTDSRQAEPTVAQWIGRTPDALANGTAVLTRAELRRRAQAPSSQLPLTRRQARVQVAPDARQPEAPALAVLDDRGPGPEVLTEPTASALELREPAPEVPVAVQAADGGTETTPISLPTSPITLPRRPRARRATSPEGAVPFEDGSRPVEDEPLAAESRREGSDEDALDEFAEALRLFSFTGETPVQAVAAAPGVSAAEPAPVAEARRGGTAFRRVATASFSVGVIGVVGLLTVGMTTPVEAVAAAQGGTAAMSVLAPGDVAADTEEIQAYVAPAGVQNPGVERSEDYKTTTIAEIAAESGISNFSNFFVNDPTSAIQWPFAVGVPITYGFGMRSGRMHEGIDFVPGAGAPIQAIADGTVRIATESGGAFGVTVVIDHVIDGELISSRYAHMQYDSLQVKPGQQVKVGTFLGRTGNTGRSYGAHTHFELLAGGTTPIDPLPWLREHAGG
jgi:murein DD-endopeptidase MepM/ murein hydrolase activator NlpD